MGLRISDYHSDDILYDKGLPYSEKGAENLNEDIYNWTEYLHNQSNGNPRVMRGLLNALWISNKERILSLKSMQIIGYVNFFNSFGNGFKLSLEKQYLAVTRKYKEKVDELV